jgi:hypothetical protein
MMRLHEANRACNDALVRLLCGAICCMAPVFALVFMAAKVQHLTAFIAADVEEEEEHTPSFRWTSSPCWNDARLR